MGTWELDGEPYRAGTYGLLLILPSGQKLIYHHE